MENQVYIGCDIGTSSTKAVACDVNGKILAESSIGYGIIQRAVNWAEQDVSVYFEAAIQTIKDVIRQTKKYSIEGLCISALYSGSGVLCDEEMEPIRPVIIWMDRRAEAESKWLKEEIGLDKIFKISGNGIDSYFGYTKLLWVKENEPENWNKVRHIMPVHSYVVYRLTGHITIDFCSAGNLGGVYDYKNHNWSIDMCELLGIPHSALPQVICDPSQIAGEINHDFQEILGLKKPVKVCVGTVDCIAAMLSAGIKGSGDNAAVLGTSLNWGVVHHDQPDNPELVSMPYCNQPLSMSYTYGGASTAGALPRWFLQTFMENETQENYKKLESEIEKSAIKPGSEGLIVLPYFMGERSPIWDENATGLMFGLTLSHTKHHIYNAILESVAFSLLHIMENFNVSKNSGIVMVGGGTKSKYWQTIFADVTGLPVYVPLHEVEAPLGDAFLAAYASGNIKSFDEIDTWVQYGAPIYPNAENHKQYMRYFEMYKNLYLALKDLMSERAEVLKSNKL